MLFPNQYWYIHPTTHINRGWGDWHKVLEEVTCDQLISASRNPCRHNTTDSVRCYQRIWFSWWLGYRAIQSITLPRWNTGCVGGRARVHTCTLRLGNGWIPEAMNDSFCPDLHVAIHSCIPLNQISLEGSCAQLSIGWGTWMLVNTEMLYDCCNNSPVYNFHNFRFISLYNFTERLRRITATFSQREKRAPSNKLLCKETPCTGREGWGCPCSSGRVHWASLLSWSFRDFTNPTQEQPTLLTLSTSKFLFRWVQRLEKFKVTHSVARGLSQQAGAAEVWRLTQFLKLPVPL